MLYVANLPRLVLLTAFFTAVSWKAAAYGEPLYSLPIQVDQTLLGTFQVDVYQDVSTPGVENSIGIQGGFLASGALELPAGYEYRWIQTVNSTLPSYSWQSPGVTYVDRLRSLDDHGVPRLALNQTPFYGDVRGPDERFTLPFGDNPARPASASTFDGTWTLSLVAVQAPLDASVPFDASIPGSRRDIYEITSFVWGFSVETDANGEAIVTLKPPFQQEPNGSLELAFRNDVSSGGDPLTFGGNAWNIQSGFPTLVIPEPGSLVMGIAALFFGCITAVRRKLRLAA